MKVDHDLNVRPYGAERPGAKCAGETARRTPHQNFVQHNCESSLNFRQAGRQAGGGFVITLWLSMRDLQCPSKTAEGVIPSVSWHSIHGINSLHALDQVCIVGYGNIGKELAPRLKPFGVRVLAVRPSWNNKFPKEGALLLLLFCVLKHLPQFSSQSSNPKCKQIFLRTQLSQS